MSQEIFVDESGNINYDEDEPIKINGEEEEIENIELEDHWFTEDKVILFTKSGKFEASRTDSGQSIESDEWRRIN